MENFHGYIAVPLEGKLRSLFGFRERPVGTVFDADSIENSFFYDAMCLILVRNAVENRTDFMDRYLYLKGKSASEVEIREAIRIYDEFLSLIE